MIVKKEAYSEQPCGPESRMVGQNEAKWPYDMGRDSPKNFALDERLANQTKLEMFQIAQAAMNELARGAGSRGSEIIFLAKIDRPAPSGGVSGDSAAVHTAADDGDVENGPRRRRGLHSPSPSRGAQSHRWLVRNARFCG